MAARRSSRWAESLPGDIERFRCVEVAILTQPLENVKGPGARHGASGRWKNRGA
jgi:hypothetical protein